MSVEQRLLMAMADEIADLRKRVAAMERREQTTNVLWLRDGVTAPSAVSGLIAVYGDTSDGDLKAKFGDGVTKVLAADT